MQSSDLLPGCQRHAGSQCKVLSVRLQWRNLILRTGSSARPWLGPPLPCIHETHGAGLVQALCSAVKLLLSDFVVHLVSRSACGLLLNCSWLRHTTQKKKSS